MAGWRRARRKRVARPLQKLRALLVCSTALLTFYSPARADDLIPLPRNDFGSVGLIEMPSARLAPDGNLTVGASFFKDTQHYNFSFEALPWLEVAFRYSGLSHYAEAGGFPVYYDRSFAMKARLWDETDIFPAFAFGINDLIGTGIYSGEYLVASKRFGDFDTTLGIGWGRLASAALFRNPFTLISSSFDTRPIVSSAGSANFVFFKGPKSSLFGGLVWHTPIDHLSLLTEYSSDKYTLESSMGGIGGLRPRSQINYGASYQLLDTVTLGLNWLYGTTIGASVSFSLEPGFTPYTQHIGDPPLPPVQTRTAEEQQQAIDILLQQNYGRKYAGGQMPMSAHGQAALVDALWDQSRKFADVAVNGKTLTLTVAGAIQTSCVDIAAVVARYDVDIDSVIATAMLPAGRPTRCSVHKQRGKFFVSDHAPGAGAAFLSNFVAEPIGFLTIDASSAAKEPDYRPAIAAIKTDIKKQNIIPQAISLTESEALVYYSNTRYSHERDAIERLVHVLMADAPLSIEKFRLIPTLGGEPQNEIDILRGPTERSIAQTGTYDIIAGGNTLTAVQLQNPVLGESERDGYPRYSWTLFPQFRQQLFDPDNPFAVQFLAASTGVVELAPGLSVSGEAEVNIYNDFNASRAPDSVLPHVRTDFLKYFTQGQNGIGDLEADYRFRLAPEVYAIARGGYLESEFAGVGGEVLWRPLGERWAVDGSLFAVQKRAFDRLFSLQDYNVVTGHIALYYASPWYGLNFVARAGQYLAGDRGVTFEATRRFSTGVEIGAFFTVTNVSAEKFGEGSFDKGFIIRIPLDWTLPVSSQGELAFDIRPVQRDGGQRLENEAILYDETRRSSYGEIAVDGTTVP